MAILELENVSVAFRGRPVLRGIRLRAARGEIVGVMGPNGAGKSTLLRVAAGLLQPASGVARVEGIEAVRARRWGRVGWTPGAEGGFTRRLTLRANLTTSARLAGLGHSRARRRIEHLAQVLGFERHLDVAAELCSTGTRQRAALARPLLHDPPLALFDEPLRGVDPAGRTALREALRAECRTRALVWVSHAAEELADVADRVLWLEGGRLRAAAPPTAPLRVTRATPEGVAAC